MMRMLDVYLFVCKFVYCVVLAPNMVIFRSSYTYEMHANNANAMLPCHAMHAVSVALAV